MINAVRRSVNQSGAALIAALLVIVILVIIAGSFALVMSRDSRTTRMSSESLVNMYAAEAGLNYALWLHKHNMAFYPPVQMDIDDDATTGDAGLGGETKAGGVYNLPYAGLTDGTHYYGPEKERLGTYYDKFAVEHVFVNDMAFLDDTNFLKDSKYCATFQIREAYERMSTNDGRVLLTIVSTGKIRSVPEGWNWFTGAMTTQKLEEQNFTEHSSRTVSVQYVIRDTVAAVNPGPCTYAPSVSVPPASVAKNNDPGRQMIEKRWREWFR